MTTSFSALNVAANASAVISPKSNTTSPRTSGARTVGFSRPGTILASIPPGPSKYSISRRASFTSRGKNVAKKSSTRFARVGRPARARARLPRARAVVARGRRAVDSRAASAPRIASPRVRDGRRSTASPSDVAPSRVASPRRRATRARVATAASLDRDRGVDSIFFRVARVARAPVVPSSRRSGERRRGTSIVTIRRDRRARACRRRARDARPTRGDSTRDGSARAPEPRRRGTRARARDGRGRDRVADDGDDGGTTTDAREAGDDGTALAAGGAG